MISALKPGRGRRQDSFDDPVWRMRAWFWLEGAKKAAGCEDAKALDDLRLIKSDRASGLFQRIEDDGFNPQNVTAVGTTSILGFLDQSEKYAGLAADYEHPLWEFLYAREGINVDRDEELTKLLERQQIVPIESSDTGRLEELGLHWPEIPDDGKCTENALIDLVHSNQLNSLDGLLLLILLYRRSMDRADLCDVEMMGGLLRHIAHALSKGWIGEMRDTWNFLIHSRMLSWQPDLQPSLKDILRSQEHLTARWEELPIQTRGRPCMHPDELGYGKGERRWRRRIWMHAAGTTPLLKDQPIGYLRRSAFTGWLQAERALIDKHLSRAGMIVVGINLEDMDTECRQKMTEILPPLNIPVDKMHPRYAPYFDEYDRTRLRQQPYDIIPVVEMNLDKK